MSSPHYQFGALKTALETYVAQTGDETYQKLFLPETGYLKCEGVSKTWAVTRAQPKDRQTFLANMDAVREGLHGLKAADIPNVLNLVQRVNKVYCDVLFGAAKIPVQKGGVIGFNSRCKDVTRILSNFFSTLLIYPDPVTGEDVIFPGSESAYQAHKVLRLEAEERPPSAPMSPLVLNSPGQSAPASPARATGNKSAPVTPEKRIPQVDSEDIRHPRRGMPGRALFAPSSAPDATAAVRSLVPPSLNPLSFEDGDSQVDATERKEAEVTTVQFTKESSPLRAKKLGGASPLMKGRKKPALTNEMAVKKFELMESIIRAKLRANPFIAERLKGTGDAFLVEDTGVDSFWGGSPQDRSLRRQAARITNASQNVLGTILMSQRGDL